MLLLRIKGKIYLAARWECDITNDIYLPPSGKKKVELANSARDNLFELCWQLTDCREAIAVFEDFEECPVCLGRSDASGALIHRNPTLLLN